MSGRVLGTWDSAVNQTFQEFLGSDMDILNVLLIRSQSDQGDITLYKTIRYLFLTSLLSMNIPCVGDFT